MIEEIDEALKDGSHRAADLKYGHDGEYHFFEASDHINVARVQHMAFNLQIVFYHKNGSDDILVKFLLNEEEKTIPALKPDKGIFYSWKNLRTYLDSLISTANPNRY